MLVLAKRTKAGQNGLIIDASRALHVEWGRVGCRYHKCVGTCDSEFCAERWTSPFTLSNSLLYVAMCASADPRAMIELSGPPCALYTQSRIIQRHLPFLWKYGTDTLPAYCYSDAVQLALHVRQRHWLLDCIVTSLCSVLNVVWPRELTAIIAKLMVSLDYETLFPTEGHFDTVERKVGAHIDDDAYYFPHYLWYDESILSDQQLQHYTILDSHEYVDKKRGRSTVSAMDMGHRDSVEPTDDDDPNPGPKKKFRALSISVDDHRYS